MEPLGVAIHASDRAKLPEGSSVLIIGAGAVGLLCAAMNKANGAKSVVICDIQGDRVNFALTNGFADGGFEVPLSRPLDIESKLLAAQEVASFAKDKALINGKPVGEFDAVFECTGVEACVQASIYVRHPFCEAYLMLK
jgi:L-iditol 2-dehydrogenase